MLNNTFANKAFCYCLYPFVYATLVFCIQIEMKQNKTVLSNWFYKKTSYSNCFIVSNVAVVHVNNKETQFECSVVWKERPVSSMTITILIDNVKRFQTIDVVGGGCGAHLPRGV